MSAVVMVCPLTVTIGIGVSGCPGEAGLAGSAEGSGVGWTTTDLGAEGLAVPLRFGVWAWTPTTTSSKKIVSGGFLDFIDYALTPGAFPY